jgi:demethylmenaquinone methyltransferase/2-methoxy-6-polyprenyl-1,4-benzoquinol methylase
MDNEKADRTAESYNKQAKMYEDKWEDYLSHTHQKMLDIFTSGQEHRILDVSAGTGLMAHHLLKKDYDFSELVLNDISEEMLNRAKKRFDEHEAVSFAEFPVEKLGFEDESFDTVISVNAFHNYTDQLLALSEIHRLLKPGGKLYLLDWNKKGVFRLVNFCIDIFTNEVIQTRSADEVKNALGSVPFQVNVCEEWRYHYWNFFLMGAEKIKSPE